MQDTGCHTSSRAASADFAVDGTSTETAPGVAELLVVLLPPANSDPLAALTDVLRCVIAGSCEAFVLAQFL